MAKNIESILEDLKAWQEENEGRAVSVFILDSARVSMSMMLGKRLELVGCMGLCALRDEKIKELMHLTLGAVEMMQEEKDNE